MSEIDSQRDETSETLRGLSEGAEQGNHSDAESNVAHYGFLLAELDAAIAARREVLSDGTARLGALAEASVREQAARISVAGYKNFHGNV